MNKNNKTIKKFEMKMNINLKKLFLWLIVFFLFVPFLISLVQLGGVEEEVPLSQALIDIKEEKVKRVEVAGESVRLEYKQEGVVKVTRKEKTESFTEVLRAAEISPTSIEYSTRDQRLGEVLLDFVGTILMIGVIAFVFMFVLRRGQQDGLFSFGKSRAKLFSKGKQRIKFKDVGGVKEAKQELEEVVDFLKHPRKYRKLGARTPKGVLLVGPSGTGKTLLARAVAGEANVPFFSMAGSEFMEMLVGIGASVTGDTPVLVKEHGKVKLVEIGKFVDKFYEGEQGGYVVPAVETKTLGLLSEKNKFWGSHTNKRPIFGGSSWQQVESVYRHKVKHIYEVDYLGGRLMTTGDHSVFVREAGGIRAKEVRALKKGDILVNLPMDTRAWDKQKNRIVHTIKSHKFPNKVGGVYLDVWQEDRLEIQKYQYAVAQQGLMYQQAIAEQIGVSQTTVGNWHRGIHGPQKLSRKLVKVNLPEKVAVSVSLCKLFGYYTAEGSGVGRLEFVFSVYEGNYVEEVADLMGEVFGLWEPKLEATDTSTIRVTYHSAHLGRFFGKHCGIGSHNKHIPEFLWEMPREYFLAYLEGYSNGGKLSMTSVSHHLIRELAWLCNMHGIKVGVKHEIQKAGRVINDKLLPEAESWTLIIEKTNNPFAKNTKRSHQFKRCIVRSVKKKKFDGFVYDFCGVDNEAFFGGETPVLLHNSRVRDLFSTAKKSAPSVIFIDEIDAIGRVRGGGFAGGGHGEQEQTLNQILVEMDGFTPNDNVLVLAATNRPALLDPALVRPGRFDRRVMLDLPDLEERKKIIKIHMNGKPILKGRSKDAVNMDKVAKRTVGFSGADLENMLNEAAIQAARESKQAINTYHIEEAATKVKLGPEKRRLQSKLEKKMTAYHEAGHAVVGHILPRTDPIHRVSIVSRGLALGYTLMPPAVDKYQQTESELKDKMAAMLGGRAAEELVFDELTGGAASDIERVTKIARTMVVDFGMSRLGPVRYSPMWDTTESGRVLMESDQVSPATKAEVDKEVRRLVDEAYKMATSLLKKNRQKLDKVSERLLKVETLDDVEFEKLMGVKKRKPGEV